MGVVDFCLIFVMSALNDMVRVNQVVILNAAPIKITRDLF